MNERLALRDHLGTTRHLGGSGDTEAGDTPWVRSAGAPKSLPEPPSLWSRRVFGPSAVFTAMAIGSGELVFWPGLSLANGAGVLWIALLVVMLQYVLNIEIGRYSLATGESAIVGAARLWKGWAWILLAGAVIPWLWPGWARAGCQLLGGVFNLPEKPLSIASLILCGLLLAVPTRVYHLLERLQAVLLIAIVAGVLGLCVLAVGATGGTGGFWSSLFTGQGMENLFSKTLNAQSAAFLALLGGIVFMGGGGILNLGYGLLLCEKKFGMGEYAKPIVGLRHSLGLRPSDEVLPQLSDDHLTSQRWRRWLGLCRREHALLFLGGNLFTVVFITLTFYSLIGPGSDANGINFLVTATDRFGQVGGDGASVIFAFVAFAIFFTSEIGIIDITSRIASGILHSTLRPRRMSASALYHAVVWFEIVVGIVLTIADPRQPFWFLVTSGILNTAVMAVYALLVAYLNRRTLPAITRPGIASTAVLGIAALVYGSLFVITVGRL